GALLVIEQGNEAGYNWPASNDEKRAVYLRPLYDMQDLGAYLQWLPEPKRVAVNDEDVKFTLGDWFRVDAGQASTASMLTSTSEMGWWTDRLSQMYGINYEVSRKPMRPGLTPLFTSKTGVVVWGNPRVFPRAWTVHAVAGAPDEEKAGDLVRDEHTDLATTA